MWRGRVLLPALAAVVCHNAARSQRGIPAFGKGMRSEFPKAPRRRTRDRLSPRRGLRVAVSLRRWLGLSVSHADSPASGTATPNRGGGAGAAFPLKKTFATPIIVDTLRCWA